MRYHIDRRSHHTISMMREGRREAKRREEKRLEENYRQNASSLHYKIVQSRETKEAVHIVVAVTGVNEWMLSYLLKRVSFASPRPLLNALSRWTAAQRPIEEQQHIMHRMLLIARQREG